MPEVWTLDVPTEPSSTSVSLRDASTDLEAAVESASLRLLPERAAYWADRSTLLVADVHLGKDATFRSQAVPLPLGSTSADLRRLGALVDRLAPERLLVLGDLYHAASGMTEAVLDGFRDWRCERSALEVVLVRGNHDRDAGASPEDLGITERDGPFVEPPFAFQHMPMDPDDDPPETGYVVAGHRHPGRVVRSGKERERLPCFHVTTRGLVLPAFSTFTGLMTITPAPGDHVLVVAGDELVRVG